MSIGQGTVIGEEDAIKDRVYSTTITCTSQIATLYKISIQHFHKAVKDADGETWNKFEKNALQKEVNTLKIMESKYQYNEEQQVIKSNMPNKFLDVELDYMKEIRETYF